MMLNNLAVLCMQLNEDQTAEEYLKKAIELSAEIPEMVELGVFYANLGLIYLKKGLIVQAKNFCNTAWRIGTKSKNNESLQQANYCLDQIKSIV